MTDHSKEPALLRRLRIALATSTALVAAPAGLTFLLAAPPVLAEETVRCDEATVPQPEDCRRTNGGLTVTMPVGNNDELIDTRPGGDFDATGFSISVDNDHVAGAPPPVDPRRATDIAAEAAGVDVRYDGLDTRRLLNVSTADLRASYPAGTDVRFRASSNYPGWIARAEIELRDASRPGAPVVAKLPVEPNGEVAWTMPADGDGEYTYVLRVYDGAGRSDETRPLDLSRSAERYATHETTGAPLVAAGEAEDHTARRGIPVHGGVVTTSGEGFTPGSKVRVMGESVPVDGSGRFVVSRILPAGDHDVTVSGTSGGRQRDLHHLPAGPPIHQLAASRRPRRRFDVLPDLFALPVHDQKPGAAGLHRRDELAGGHPEPTRPQNGGGDDVQPDLAAALHQRAQRRQHRLRRPDPRRGHQVEVIDDDEDPLAGEPPTGQFIGTQPRRGAALAMCSRCGFAVRMAISAA